MKVKNKQKKGKIVKEIEYCPTQHGTFQAYEPIWRIKGGEWKTVPVRENILRIGVPPPRTNGGITSTIGLHGYAEAMALAWWYAAISDSQGITIEVCVREYQVEYDIKAHKIKTNPKNWTNRLDEIGKED